MGRYSVYKVKEKNPSRKLIFAKIFRVFTVCRDLSFITPIKRDSQFSPI
jgi:hypothetical protein